jgi:hypothetical protein
MNPSFPDWISFGYILILFSHLYLDLENGSCASRSIKTFVCISHLSLAYCIPRSSQTLRFYYQTVPTVKFATSPWLTSTAIRMRSVFRRVRKISKSDLTSSCLSVRPPVRPPAWNNSAATELIFMKFDIWVYFDNLSRKLKFHYNLTVITGALL